MAERLLDINTYPTFHTIANEVSLSCQCEHHGLTSPRTQPFGGNGVPLSLSNPKDLSNIVTLREASREDVDRAVTAAQGALDGD